MNLYLMRHGIAVAADDLGIIQDKERPLTGKGIKRMRRAARGLRRLEIEFDGILTSPLLRARQTADIVAAALGMESRLEEITELAPESSVQHLIFGLTRYQDRDHLLLVGHQPLLGQTLASLIDPSPGAKQPIRSKQRIAVPSRNRWAAGEQPRSAALADDGQTTATPGGPFSQELSAP
ncbi:MAG: phosphohistidine phosphatase SixA [Candidatus Binatia bacterium]